eukprot:9223860-Pyramimonas_sp.AAC.1
MSGVTELRRFVGVWGSTVRRAGGGERFAGRLLAGVGPARGHLPARAHRSHRLRAGRAPRPQPHPLLLQRQLPPGAHHPPCPKSLRCLLGSGCPQGRFGFLTAEGKPPNS